MKKFFLFSFLLVILFYDLFSQRKTEKLGRGLIVVYIGDNKAYIGWRLLATDINDISFNIYKSEGGSFPVKLNIEPISKTTDFIDNNVNTSVRNCYYLRPVVNGIEKEVESSFCIGPNPEKKQYIRIPVQPIEGKYDYDMKFCWVGDLDGDGEYDYVIDRLPWGQYPDSVGGRTAKIEAYKSDGTFLWRIDVGPNVAISTGHSDMVTVFDMDCDGFAEVILKTSEGTIFGNGHMIGDINEDGKIDYRDKSGNVVGHAPQFISIIDGRTGIEKARTYIPHQDEDSPTPGKKYWELGPFTGHFGVLYLDGKKPSFLFHYTNRNNAGPYDKCFNQFITTWDYKDGQLIQRTDFNDACGVNIGQCYNHFHQIRIMDVDQDGKDEMIEGGFVIDDNGLPLWGNCEIIHGDRHQTSDLDPERPGLETFLIQQENPSSLGMALIDAATGQFIKKWYQSTVADVGRGEAVDVDSSVFGVEVFSTMPGMYSSKGEYLGEHSIFPNSGIWWDADLLREMMRSPDGNGFNIHICKPGKYGSTYTEGPRLYEIAKESGYLVSASYGCRPMFEGDILGDWREEIILKERNPENTGNVAFRIYTTTIPAINRLYCLMQNPGYRQTTTVKGYYQAPYTDYYLGYGMGEPPVPPIQKAKLYWRGDITQNYWDLGITKNFENDNNLSEVFSNGDDVIFDVAGISNNNIDIRDTLKPSKVFVFSPKNKLYRFYGNGVLSGNMQLIKSGAGDLIIDNYNNYRGNTIVTEGNLHINGKLQSSNVYVYYYGAIGGNGIYDSEIYLSKGSKIIPGYDGIPGVLTFIKDLNLSGKITLKFDLSNDTSQNNDKIIINGNLNIQGENTIEINKIKDSLSQGKYILLEVHGIINGQIEDFKIRGISDIKYSLYIDSGKYLILKVEGKRPPTTITWRGISEKWDLLNTENWFNKNLEPTVFSPGDTVIFNHIGKDNPVVNITEGEKLISKMIIEANTTSYKFIGSGSITGNADVIKNGYKSFSLLTKNSYVGKTIINNGELEVSFLDDAGLPSSIGSTTSTDPSYFILNDARLKYSGIQNIYTNRGITLNGSYDTIEVTQNNKILTLKGLITGTANLVKDGDGILVIQGNINTYKGNTIINKGVISLGDETANTSGLHGDIIFKNGTLNMFNNSATYTQFYNNLVIDEGCVGTLITDDRCDIRGNLNGSGTFNYYVSYVRATIYGDWSSFKGIINVTTDGSGDFRFANSKGLPEAIVNFGDGTYAYRLNGGILTIGELRGTKNSEMSGTDWIIGSKNTNSTYPGKISGESLTKIGKGSLTLTGSYNNYSKGTNVKEGKLLICNISGRGAGTGNIVVDSGAVLGGSGFIRGSIMLKKGAILEPGCDGIGTLTDSSDFTINSGSIIKIDIKKASNLYDKLKIVGKLKYGGILYINKIDITPFSVTDSFRIFYANSYEGNFEQIIPEKPGDSLLWDTTALRINGCLKIKKELVNEVKYSINNNVKIYPNPCNEFVNVEVFENIDELIVELLDINGRTLNMFKTTKKKIAIDLVNYNDKVYLLKIILNDKVFIKKIIKK